MRGKANFFILTILLMALATTVMAADPPNSIVYQGRLADTSGTPITATVNVQFSIYSAPSGGTAWWDSTYSITPNTNGLFTQDVGPIPTSVFTGIKLYLGIKVGSDPEMTPRQVMTSAPYSFQSLTLAPNSVTNITIATGAVSNTKLASGAVSEIKLAGNAVTTSKIASGAVSNSDLATNAVTGVKVLNSSLTRSDIADEPGIVREMGPGGLTIPTSGHVTIDSVSITVPGAGYVVAMAFGYGQFMSNASGLMGNVLLGFETLATTSPRQPYTVLGGGNQSIGANKFSWHSFASERTFAVSGAGKQTYYFNASRGWDTATVSIESSKFLLLYFPSSYGTVSAVASQNDATDLESSTPISFGPNPADPNSVPEVMYQVDLRELEIKALKAQLEAEEAQQKLDDARSLQEADSQKEN